MLKTWIITVLLISSLLINGARLYSCTIFYIAKGHIILAGNNEDWKDPLPEMSFYPAEDGKHGWIKFGWGSGFPQGGMNDHGLFWDGSSVAYLGMPYSEENKELYSGPIMQMIIEECKNIEEALEVFSAYYCQDQYNAQYLVGDSSGYSIIVEGDSIISKEGDYQLMTNFYYSHPDLAGYPCWRYEAASEILSDMNEPTPYLMGSVLSATHQEGKYPTQYSVIYDLKQCLVYLFYYHNYEEYLLVDLLNELSKGKRNYAIPGLFSKVKLKVPGNGEVLDPSSVTFSWQGLAESTYELEYSTSIEFSDFKSVFIEVKDNKAQNKYVILCSLPALLLFILWVPRQKKIFIILLLLISASTSNHCKKEDKPEETDQVVLFTKTIEGLLPNTTYYWKIKSTFANQGEFKTETISNWFKTGE
jgi:hypothetical protein